MEVGGGVPWLFRQAASCSSLRHQELRLLGQSCMGRAWLGRAERAASTAVAAEVTWRVLAQCVQELQGRQSYTTSGSCTESLRAALMISLGAITGGTGWGRGPSASSSASSSARWAAPMGADSQRGRGATSFPAVSPSVPCSCRCV